VPVLFCLERLSVFGSGSFLTQPNSTSGSEGGVYLFIIDVILDLFVGYMLLFWMLVVKQHLLLFNFSL